MKQITYSDLNKAGINVAQFAVKECGLSSRQALYSLLVASSKRRLKGLKLIRKGLKKLKRNGNETKQIQKLLNSIEREISKRESAYRVLSSKSIR